jgi:hypothetical protein
LRPTEGRQGREHGSAGGPTEKISAGKFHFEPPLFCASNPAAVARRLVDGGFTGNYDHALQTLKEVWYNKWREYDIEDSVRFYSLRLREAGMIKSAPSKIIADGTNLRFLNEFKRELKGSGSPPKEPRGALFGRSP